MKTKELIQRLQQVDPSGEIEVCVENVDIHFVERMPAYWDGPLQVLVRDETTKYYNIVGAKYKREGEKIKIHTHSIADAILTRNDLPIDYTELDTYRQEMMKAAHQQLRDFHKQVCYELELENFLDWVRENVERLTVDCEGVKEMATSFFHKNINPEEPLPAGYLRAGESHNSARQKQWGEKIEVVMEHGFVKIQHKDPSPQTR